MGRFPYSNRQEADSLPKLAIWRLKKFGYLNGWKSGTVQWTRGFGSEEVSVEITVSIAWGDPHMRLIYTQMIGSKKKDFDHEVGLKTTPCHYGGKRYWFTCPGIHRYCGKRVGILYLKGIYFACRTCHDLTYLSRKTNARYPLPIALLASFRAGKLGEKIKRHFYAGKPTKKQHRLMQLMQKSGGILF